MGRALRKVYAVKFGNNKEIYGYFELFVDSEPESFVIIASDEFYGYIFNDDPQEIRPVKQDELLLLFGMKFKSLDFEKLLKGKSNLKLED